VPGGRGRITEEKLAEFWQRLGYRDECLITAEPFKMWVIEDRFAGGATPDFERIGVKLVSASTVKAYEDMKLQVLNGAHTSMVHAGCLLGIKFIKDTVVHPLIKPYIESLVFDEVAPFMSVPETDVTQFARDAITRFGNRQLEHTNYQVAMYGTEKVKDRLMPSILRYIEKTRTVPQRLSLAIAILFRYVTGFKQGKGIDTRGDEVEGMLGIDERGETYFIDDPRAKTIANALKMNLSREESEPILDRILSDKEMFRVDLYDYGNLAQTIKGYYHKMKENGLAATLGNLEYNNL
jgi:mannitol-1-phosphate/altronate dehydrogenase